MSGESDMRGMRKVWIVWRSETREGAWSLSADTIESAHTTEAGATRALAACVRAADRAYGARDSHGYWTVKSSTETNEMLYYVDRVDVIDDASAGAT